MSQFLPSRENEPVDFVAEQECWNKYRLDDGTIIKLRVMIGKVVPDGYNQESGLPQYQIQCHQVIDITHTPQQQAEAAARIRGQS